MYVVSSLLSPFLHFFFTSLSFIISIVVYYVEHLYKIFISPLTVLGYMRRSLITGITGQDGSLLAKLLLDKGYEVYGTVRRVSTPNLWRLKALGIYDKVTLIDADVTDLSSVQRAVEFSDPDEVYHLASQSHVGVSFSQPLHTLTVTGLGTANVLEAVRLYDKSIAVYVAGTSEVFGECKGGVCNESSPFDPHSPYAVAKAMSVHIARVYRSAYDMHVSVGLLFNHESEYRGLDFVTRKISNAVAKISLGLEDELVLGNLEAKRDWGYAPEYVEGMWLMLQQDRPDDYVLATRESHSVREFVEEAFRYVGLDWSKYVRTDTALYRPYDVCYLVGDYSKAESVLGWRPRMGFKDIVRLMVDADLTRWQKYLRGEQVIFDAVTG